MNFKIDHSKLVADKQRLAQRLAHESALHEAEKYLSNDSSNEISTKFARDIVYWAVEYPKKALPTVNDHFVPGRLQYTYNLGFEGELDNLHYNSTPDEPIPTLKSKSEVRNFSKNLSPPIDQALLLQIISQLRNPPPKKTLKPIPPPSKATEPVPVISDDDDDIFADVGRDYELKPSEKPSTTSTTVKTDYFGSEVIDGKLIQVEDDELNQQISIQLKETLKSVRQKRGPGTLYEDDGFSDDDFDPDEPSVKKVKVEKGSKDDSEKKAPRKVTKPKAK